ncbi:MAG: outer membrane protein assembly factor BamD, partial [Phycisphaeraceae bacterium]|nr:outer membrane protein assembly factor BamD [Phycisphaeraceae bacterium]
HPLAVQAHLLKGDAKTARRDYYKALFDYEYVIRQYPAAEEFNVALEREYRIAQLFASGVNRRFLGMPILPATGEAEEIFIRIQERAPGSELGEEASLALADLYYKQDEMASAADGYDLFLVNYPHSRHRERAMLRLIQSNLNRFRGPEFDPTGLLNATATIKRYQQEFPAAAEKIDAQALLAKIDQSEARKLAIQAAWYDRRGEPVSATYLRQRLVTEHPATPSAQAALTKLPAPAVPAPTPDDAKP